MREARLNHGQAFVEARNGFLGIRTQYAGGGPLGCIVGRTRSNECFVKFLVQDGNCGSPYNSVYLSTPRKSVMLITKLEATWTLYHSSTYRISARLPEMLRFSPPWAVERARSGVGNKKEYSFQSAMGGRKTIVTWYAPPSFQVSVRHGR
jgi:hypothetical protein